MKGSKLEYKYIEAPRITSETAHLILSGARRVSLDLGLSYVEIEVKGGEVRLGESFIPLSELKKLRDNIVYEVVDGVLKPIEIRSMHGYYKLRHSGPNTAPTIEINGVHMHRIVGTDPWRDSMDKVSAAKITQGHMVLDTCMGLGYTAIGSLLRGASRIITVEIDLNVFEISRHNPWSKSLGDPRIEIMHGDIVEVVSTFGDEYFHRVIHDPPRFSRSTGALYSTAFYRELFRVLKPGGRLYHYTGQAGRLRGRNLLGSVAGRLREVGFDVRPDRSGQGLIGVKTGF